MRYSIDTYNYYSTQGMNYLKKNKFPKATKEFTKAIELTNKLNLGNIFAATAYNRRGLAYKGQKQFQEALIDFSKAIALNPNVPYFYHTLGLALAELEQYQKAKEAFKKADKLGINYSDKMNKPGKHRTFGMYGSKYYLIVIAPNNNNSKTLLAEPTTTPFPDNPHFHVCIPHSKLPHIAGIMMRKDPFGSDNKLLPIKHDAHQHSDKENQAPTITGKKRKRGYAFFTADDNDKQNTQQNKKQKTTAKTEPILRPLTNRI